MPRSKRPTGGVSKPAELSPRPHDGHQSFKAGHAADVADPHPAWLKKWRSLRTGLSGRRISEGPAQSLRELQNRIARTPADTLAGLQAQAELISELAWNDVVAATARQLIAGIKRLRQSGLA